MTDPLYLADRGDGVFSQAHPVLVDENDLETLVTHHNELRGALKLILDGLDNNRPTAHLRDICTAALGKTDEAL